jgi:hypothetical protein
MTLVLAFPQPRHMSFKKCDFRFCASTTDSSEHAKRIPASFFYYSRIKKGEGQGKYVTFSTMMHKEASEDLQMTGHHVPLRQMID